MDRLAKPELRLEAWREEVAEYFQQGDEYGSLAGRPNLAHPRFGTKISVDSYFSTINTENVSDLYWTLNQVEVKVEVKQSERLVEFQLTSNMPNLAHYEVSHKGWPWTEVAAEWKTFIPDQKAEFQFRAVNSLGVPGPATSVQLCPVGEELECRVLGQKIIKSPLPFKYENYTHPELVRLRSKYRLDEKLGEDELDVLRLVPLVTWLKGLWVHGQPLRLPPFNAHHIIERGSRGLEQFHCVHYSVSFVQSCLSLGIPARMVNLHRGIAEDCVPGNEPNHDPPCDEHVVVEVWSNDLLKWVVFDVDYDCYYTVNGELLNCQDIHSLLLAGKDHEIQMCAGPLTASEMKEQTLAKRLSYYRHYSVILRNDFLSDPHGPVRIAHLVDDQTEPILWWFGEDMVWRHHLMGPVHVAKPYKNQTRILHDGRLHTAWASSDAATDHWIEISWPEAVTVSTVIIHWADRQGFQTSRKYRVEVWQNETWRTVSASEFNQEHAWNRHDFDDIETTRVRIVQPPGGGSIRNPNVLWVRQVQVF